MILRTINLSKRFGHRWAVADLNLAVEAGQIFGFLGPNGAGKSTTIRMLLNLIRPTRGTFKFFGQESHRPGVAVYRRIGALVEKPDFYLYLSAKCNLRMLGELNGGINSARINEVLEIVNLQDRINDKVKDYSHGMRQRLGIAQAILHDPELIILDEPTTGLDPVGIKEIRELIISLARDFGKTIFLSSHLLHEVEQVCSHMAIIDNGKLIVQGAVHDLLKETDFYVTEIVVDDPIRAQEILSTMTGVTKITASTNSLKVQADDIIRPVIIDTLVRNGLKISAAIPRTSLEDYYLSLVQHSDGK